MNVRLAKTLAVMLAAHTWAIAQPPATNSTGRSTPQRQTVEQKITLVSRMLHDSPIAARVQASNSTEAKNFLVQADASLRRAHASVGTNNLADADTALNEAMWQIGKARELVPDSTAQQIGERVRYAQLSQGYELIESAYQRHLDRMKHQPDGDFGRARMLAAEARQLADAEKYLESNALLTRARDLMLQSYHSHLGSMTIVYAPVFDAPVDEYRYELDRYRDYEALLPLALRELNASRESSALVARIAERAKALQQQSVQQAARSDFKAATRSLNQATAQLQRALAAAGLVVPQQLPED